MTAKRAEDEDVLLAVLPEGPPGVSYEALVMMAGFSRSGLEGLLRGLGERVGRGRDGQRRGGPMLFWQVAG